MTVAGVTLVRDDAESLMDDNGATSTASSIARSDLRESGDAERASRSDADGKSDEGATGKTGAEGESGPDPESSGESDPKDGSKSDSDSEKSESEKSDKAEKPDTVDAPDPTPLTLEESPLAGELTGQSEEGQIDLGSAVLPSTVPDFSERAQALAAEQERVARLVEERVAQLKAEEEARKAAAEKAKKAEEARRADEWVLPLSNYRLSARFGQSGRMWSSGQHTGVDMSAPSGTELVAMQDAVVVSAGYSGAYGNRTVFKLADGTEYWYAHQSSIDVDAGQVVRKGDRVGAVGATGNVTGPHLHLELHPADSSSAADPLPAMRKHGLSP